MRFGINPLLSLQTMNAFKKIAGHIYFFYGMLLFLITMLLIAIIPACIALLFKEPRRAKIIHPTYNIWMRIFLPLVFIRVYRKGKGLFETKKNYVVVINHNSLVDIPVSMPWVPGPNKTLAKSDMAKIPLFGVIYKAGSILLNRKDVNSRKDSILQMDTTLNDFGLHLTLYPEGTRNKSSAPLLPFYDGAFITAIKNKKPVIAGIIFNTKKILPGRPSFWAWPYSIHIHFIKAYETAHLVIEQRTELKNEVSADMKAYYVANADKY